MIREMFESWFPSEAAASTAVRWIPRADWGCAADRASIAVRLADVCSFWSGGRDSRRGAAGQAIDARDHSLMRRARYAVADYATALDMIGVLREDAVGRFCCGEQAQCG